MFIHTAHGHPQLFCIRPVCQRIVCVCACVYRFFWATCLLWFHHVSLGGAFGPSEADQWYSLLVHVLANFRIFPGVRPSVRELHPDNKKRSSAATPSEGSLFVRMSMSIRKERKERGLKIPPKFGGNVLQKFERHFSLHICTLLPVSLQLTSPLCLYRLPRLE